MKTKILHLFTITTISMICNFALAGSGIDSSGAPRATAEEALIKHWREPELNQRFMDIPELEKAYISASPENLNDGIAVGNLSSRLGDNAAIVKLAKEIAEEKHGQLDSLLIAHQGELLFESYYRRGRIDLSHPQSSATKSYTSLAVGRAIQLGYLSMADLDKPVISFLKDLDHARLADGAGKVTLRRALTMTTGITISEEQWQQINDNPEKLKGQQEVQVILETSQPISDDTQVFKYGTGPQLIMQVLDAVVPGSAQNFIKTELLDKLGIHNYSWKNAASGLPESGWKASITSRDMLKFGLLFSSNGKWQEQQLISAAYLSDATRRHIFTGDDDIYGGGKDVSRQGYGYYFWGTDLHHNGKHYPSASAQGGGGMYILHVKALNLVVVITAHHRDQTTQQMIAERILPAFVAS